MIYLAVKYAFFAAAATGVNLLFQYFSLTLYDKEFSLYIAIAVGTAAGLIVKYILDKKYIFYYTTENSKDDFGKFLIYTFMGLFTTVIFWGTELGFNYFFKFSAAKYIGGALGLSIGYLTKYFLDKRFVFVNKSKF